MGCCVMSESGSADMKRNVSRPTGQGPGAHTAICLRPCVPSRIALDRSLIDRSRPGAVVQVAARYASELDIHDDIGLCRRRCRGKRRRKRFLWDCE